MQSIFSKEKILNLSISPYDKYCIGYTGKGRYITALVMGIGSFKETFSHVGSDLLDSIVAYDRAEVDDIYIGQINMTIVSSFCGPEGLIWGYDIANNVKKRKHFLLSSGGVNKFKGIKIRSGEGLRDAARMLFGTNKEKHFPFLPGSHVCCAGKYRFFKGPTFLYAAVAIGIPKDRNRSACLLMEDVGQLIDIDDKKNIGKRVKKKLIVNMIKSVLEIGKNQKIIYEEIIVDFIAKKINAGEVGCSLIAMPYFHLAKNAYDKSLPKEKLKDWVNKKKRYFLQS